MVVTWVTLDETKTPYVEYGINGLRESAEGVTTKFTDGGSEKRVLYIHRVTLTDLIPDQKYSNQTELKFMI